MSEVNNVENHYTHLSLLSSIEDGVRSIGKTPDSVTLDELASVDEFHIGGSIATEAFLDQLDISSGDLVLDIGAGLGGGSRFAASRYGCSVVGVDLTRGYVDTGNALSSWLGMDNKVTLEHGDATKLSFGDVTFDKAFMLHVGMNIDDKLALASGVYRVLKPGGVFGIYDVMRVNEGELAFPVPWATHPEISFVSTIEHYKEMLQKAGFEIASQRNRGGFAEDFFAELRSSSNRKDGPPPLGLHLLMGDTVQMKVENMIENILKDLIAPVELIATKITE